MRTAGDGEERRGPGRPRKWASEAERVRAYRGNALSIKGLGHGRYEIGVVASYGMSSFIEDSIIQASGKKHSGKRYSNTTRASDKNRSRAGGTTCGRTT